MLKKVVVTNYLGESIECKIEGVEAENDSGLIITSIDGLGPVKATINMTEIPSSDGSIYNSSRLTNRNIVIKAIFTHASSIEEARHLSYKYFPINKKLTLEIETDSRTGTVEGYVESNEPDIFSKQSSFQVSIVCESAYFDDIEAIHSGFVMHDNSGACSVNFQGDTNEGVLLSFKAGGDVTDLSVHGVDDHGNVTGEMALDMSKLATSVPNTSPNNTPVSECAFAVDFNDIYDRTSRFIWPPYKDYRSNPQFINDTFQYKNGELFCYAFFGEIWSYPLCLFSTLRCKFSRFNEGDDSWREIGSYRFETPEAVINLGWPYSEIKCWPMWIVWDRGGNEDDLFALVMFEHDSASDDFNVLYKFNRYTNQWDVVHEDTAKITDVYYTNTVTNSFRACMVNGVIHMLYNKEANTYPIRYATFSRTNQRWIDRGQLFYEDPDRNTWPVFDNLDSYPCISLIPVCRYGGYEELHYVKPYDSYAHHTMDISSITNTWLQVEEDDCTVIDSAYLGRLCEVPVSDDFSGFYGFYGDAIYRYYSRNRNQGEWSLVKNNVLGSSVFDSASFEKMIEGDTEDQFYLFYGTPDYGQYTESPNNVKLINKDVLYINTVNGKKRVTIKRNNVEYNAINALNRNPVWLKLNKGGNTVSFAVTTTETVAPPIDEAYLDATTQYEGM